MQFPRFDLAGQVSLVTGAARGLGRSISLALAHAGSDVALGLRDIHSSGTLVSEIETLGRKALPLQMDVTHLDQIFRAVEQAAAHFGRLDILVNNAGIAPENLAENFTEADFDATVAVNLKGAFFTSQAAGRVMIRQKRGRIINLGSQAGFVALADPAFRSDVIERIAALHRIGDPVDVAGAVVFLASPAASLITGHTLLIDGGWTARELLLAKKFVVYP